MRVVLDTNVLARAADGPPGLANELVLACTQLPHDLVLSPQLVSKLSRVLRYERVRSQHGLSDEGIETYLADLQAVAVIVLPPPEPRPVVPFDPDDDPVVATAIAAQADVLCTLDRHLHHPSVVRTVSATGSKC